MMPSTTWQYKSMIVETSGFISRGKLDVASTDQLLNQSGQEGWELVAVTAIGDGSVGTARLLYTFKMAMDKTSQ